MEIIRYISLYDICDFESGVTSLPKNYKENGKYSFLEYKNVYSKKTIFKTDEFLKINLYEKDVVKYYVSHENQIIGTWSSENNSDVFQTVHVNTKEKFIVNGFSKILKIKSDLFLSKWLSIYINFSKSVNHIRKSIPFTTRCNMTMSIIKMIKIPIIDLNVQQQIIDIIEPFEKIRENYWNKINSLLRLISSIRINKEKKFYLKNHTEMLRNKKHNIHQVSAKVLNKQNPIVNDFEKENTYKTNTFFCEKNTLIINTIRTYLRKFCILPKDSDVTGTMVQLVVKDKHTSILNNLLNDSFWEQAVKLSKGTKMPQISVDSLLNSIKLYECNIEIKNLFNYITNMNNVILYIEKIINNLISLYIKD